jgi:protein O-GlcNAc transferase
MKKVVSFSLWGNHPKYTIGAIRNVELAKKFYPDFECWFYIHQKTVPQSIIDELQKHETVKIFFREGRIHNIKPLMWRFEPIDDPEVEIMISRDADSRIYLREKLAVDEWLESGKLFHIMRDHPYHSYQIQAGMFGARKNPNIPSWIELINKVIQPSHSYYDQFFLRDIIYPIIKPDSLVHTCFVKFPNENVKQFPIDYDDEYHFVGEYVYENESRNHEHIGVLKSSVKK